MAAAEIIVICIDNSMFNSGNFKAQCDAIEYYCKAKLDANPENEVVLFTMSSSSFRVLLSPTSDLQEILACLQRIYPAGGRLQFSLSIEYARIGFTSCPPSKQKRMLFFVGDLTDMDSKAAEKYGKMLKDWDIAVDVVNFYLEEIPKFMVGYNQHGRMELDALVAAANCNDNSHIIHVESGYSVCEVLSKSILKKTLRRSRKKNYKKKATWKNLAAAAAAFEKGKMVAA